MEWKESHFYNGNRRIKIKQQQLKFSFLALIFNEFWVKPKTEWLKKRRIIKYIRKVLRR